MLAQELQLLVVVQAERETIGRPLRQHRPLSVLLPQLGPIHIGLVHTGLSKKLEIIDTPLPAIPLKNRDRIRRSEFPILWIPRTECLDDYV